MRTTAIIKIISNLILVIFLIAIFTNLLNGNSFEFKGFKLPIINLGSFSYNFNDSDKYSIADEKIQADNINKIDVDWISGKIRIEEYSGDEIEFYEEYSSSLNEDNKMRYMFEDGTLKIKFRKPYKGFGSFKSLDKTLVIRIPISMEDGLSQLKIDNVSSIIDIDALISDIVTIDSVSGQINIRNLIANKLDIESVSGSIYVSDSSVNNFDGEAVNGAINVDIESNSIEKIDAESVSGNISLDFSTCPRELDIESISGSVNISIPENDGFIVKYSTLSGKFKSDFEVILTKEEAIYKEGRSSKSNMMIETLSGGININKK